MFGIHSLSVHFAIVRLVPVNNGLSMHEILVLKSQIISLNLFLITISKNFRTSNLYRYEALPDYRLAQAT